MPERAHSYERRQGVVTMLEGRREENTYAPSLEVGKKR